MKRTPLKPRTKPLKRGKAPTRSPLVRKVVSRIKNKGKPRFAKGRDPQYLEWIRGLPCVLRGRRNCYGVVHDEQMCAKHSVEASHVKSRGAGGADHGNTVPLDAYSHETQHTLGIRSWAEMWFRGGLGELRRIAAEVYPRQYFAQKELGWAPSDKEGSGGSNF